MGVVKLGLGGSNCLPHLIEGVLTSCQVVGGTHRTCTRHHAEATMTMMMTTMDAIVLLP